MSTQELIRIITKCNTEPITARLLAALPEKIPKKVANSVEAKEHFRIRIIVGPGIPESNSTLLPFQRQKDLDDKITHLIYTLKVDC